ncbi:MAG: GNAT family N-acetyltransferase [Ruminococcaceae bacterium]|nr:GNAT family N-acetyltransferase [Oscillospiraceae bacterium]
MNIRRANERDIAGINALLYQVHRIHAEGRPDIFRLGNKKYNDEELCAIIANVTTPIFVAVDENETVLGYAFCIYEEVKNNPSLMDRKTVYIDDLCVDATRRGEHIGTALYDYVKEEAKREECSAVTLNVWCLNEGAMRFYEKCGMKPLKVVMEQELLL